MFFFEKETVIVKYASSFMILISALIGLLLQSCTEKIIYEITNIEVSGSSNSGIDIQEFGQIVFGLDVTLADKRANTATIQAAINAVTGNGAHLLIPEGNIYLDGTIQVNRDRIQIQGAGIYTTTIYADSGIVFNFSKGTDEMLYQCSLSDLSILGTSSVKKTAVRVTDAGVMDIENITIGSWTGNTSIGIQYQGRDILSVSKSTIFADIPISIEDNPNASIDIDHGHFSDLYLGVEEGPASTKACVRIASGVNLTNVIFDGYQAWVCGENGLYWNDTTTTETSLNLKLENIRWEQSSSGANGNIIHIRHNQALQNLVIDNIFGAANSEGNQSTNGVYLHGIRGGIISNSMILAGEQGSPRTAFSLDSTTYPIVISNVFMLNSLGAQSIGAGLTPRIYVPRDDFNGISYAVYDHNNWDQGTIFGTPITGETAAVDSGAVAEISSAINGVLIINSSGGPNAIYSLRGALPTVEMSDPDGWFSSERDSPGFVNIYWSETQSKIELQNLIGFPLHFSWIILGSVGL